MNEITDKTMVVVSRLGDFWVTEQRAKAITEILAVEPNATIDIDGNYLAVRTIDGIVNPKQYGEVQAKRRGAWQCKHNYWHEKFDKCAHGRM